MTFTKPQDITYTQMAQWIDSNGVTDDCNEELLCQYLYHLFYITIQKNGYFKDQSSIDDFALYCTSRLFNRIRSDLTTPIKSVSNYIKNVVSLWRADYIREFCTGCPELEFTEFNLTDFSDYLIDEASTKDFYNYSCECVKITDVIRKHLKKIPRKKHSCEWSNIYVSCLLTLQDRMLKAAELSKKLQQLRDPRSVDTIIRSLKTRPAILFHVEEHTENYILTLVNEIVHAIAAEVSYSVGSKVSVSACMRNLVIAASNQEEE